MFREMRRKNQKLSIEESMDILEKGTSGVLALLGDEGYPYALPISYVYHNGKLYFHAGKRGHKIEAIENYNKASFCVIDKDQIVPDEYTTYFRSVIAFGKIRIMEDENEKREALVSLAKKYRPQASLNDHQEAMDREWKAVCLIELEIEHMTGKEAIELVRARG